MKEYRLTPDGRFKVSNEGDVIRIKDGEEKHAAINYTCKNKNYAATTYCEKGKQKHCYVHRLIACTFLPNPNNYPQINHIDGDPRNNHVENLEWCTGKQNMAHAHRTGLIGKPCHYCGRLTITFSGICPLCSPLPHSPYKPRTKEQKLKTMTIAYLVSSERAKAGLTQARLGELCGLDSESAQSFVIKWEKGKVPIPRHYLEKLIAILKDPVIVYYALKRV